MSAKRMLCIEYVAPSTWASYLINGDTSGITLEDRTAADQFLAWVDLGAPVDCEDCGFVWRHDAWQFYPLGADCQRYSFMTPPAPELPGEVTDG